MNSNRMVTGATIALLAAQIILSGCEHISKSSDANVARVKCAGVNECAGHTACKSATNTCKAQNVCRGEGWLYLTEKECRDEGGKIVL